MTSTGPVWFRSSHGVRQGWLLAGAGFVVGALLLAGVAVTDRGSGSSLSAPAVYYLRPYGDKKGVEDKRPVSAHANRGKGTHQWSVEVEAGSESTVTLLRRPDECGGDDSHVTCGSALGSSVTVTAAAVKGSKVGDTGFLRFTYGAKGGKELTVRTKVVVGEPVVEIRARKKHTGVPPGGGISPSFVVRNTGELPVRGLGLSLFTDPSWTFTKQGASCRFPREDLAWCDMPDLRIAPGQTVTVRPALRMRVSRTEMYGGYRQNVWPLAVGSVEDDIRLGGGQTGTSQARAAGVEPERIDDLVLDGFVQREFRTPISLAQRSDYEVRDIDVRGEPGVERRVKVTIRNNGPGNPVHGTQVVVTPPPGAQVLKQPMTEIEEDYYEPYCVRAGADYKCGVDGLEPGTSRTFEFTLRLGEQGAGEVRIEDYAQDWTDPAVHVLPPDWRHDSDPTNDRAVIRVLR